MIGPAYGAFEAPYEVEACARDTYYALRNGTLRKSLAPKHRASLFAELVKTAHPDWIARALHKVPSIPRNRFDAMVDIIIAAKHAKSASLALRFVLGIPQAKRRKLVAILVEEHDPYWADLTLQRDKGLLTRAERFALVEIIIGSGTPEQADQTYRLRKDIEQKQRLQLLAKASQK